MMMSVAHEEMECDLWAVPQRRSCLTFGTLNSIKKKPLRKNEKNPTAWMGRNILKI